MSKSVKKNFIYNVIFQVVILIVPLITTPYVSRVLGANNIGQFSFATSLVTYFVVFATLGSTIFGQRAIAFHRDDKEKLSEVFWNIFTFRLISGIIAIVLYLLFLYFIEGIALLKLLAIINIVNVIVDISWFYHGIEEFKRTVIRSVIVKAFSLLLVYIFVNSEDDTWIYTVIISGSLVLGNIALWLILPKYVELPRTIRPFQNIKGMFSIFLPTIATQVYMILDKSMIGWITESDYSNGCYEQSEKLARAGITVVTSIGAVILPRVANLYKKGEVDKAKHYIYLSYNVVWMIAFPLMFGLLSVSSFLIPIYLGENYDLSITLLQIFSLLILFVSLAYVTGISYLTPTNQQNIYTVSVTVAAIVNFGMNFMMIPQIGAIGAAIASVTAEFIGAAIQIMYCVIKKQLDAKEIFGGAWKYLASSLSMLVVINVLKMYMAINIRSLLLLIIIGAVVYVVMLLLLKETLFTSNCRQIIKKFCSVKRFKTKE